MCPERCQTPTSPRRFSSPLGVGDVSRTTITCTCWDARFRPRWGWGMCRSDRNGEQTQAQRFRPRWGWGMCHMRSTLDRMDALVFVPVGGGGCVTPQFVSSIVSMVFSSPLGVGDVSNDIVAVHADAARVFVPVGGGGCVSTRTASRAFRRRFRPRWGWGMCPGIRRFIRAPSAFSSPLGVGDVSVVRLTVVADDGPFSSPLGVGDVSRRRRSNSAVRQFSSPLGVGDVSFRAVSAAIGCNVFVPVGGGGCVPHRTGGGEKAMKFSSPLGVGDVSTPRTFAPRPHDVFVPVGGGGCVGRPPNSPPDTSRFRPRWGWGMCPDGDRAALIRAVVFVPVGGGGCVCKYAHQWNTAFVQTGQSHCHHTTCRSENQAFAAGIIPVFVLRAVRTSREFHVHYGFALQWENFFARS